MSRQVQTPGVASPAPASEPPAASPSAAPEGLSPELARLVQGMVAQQVAAALAKTTPRAERATPKEVPMDVAVAMANDAVARGERPRSILTPEGWYCHRELARSQVMGSGDSGATAKALQAIADKLGEPKAA